MMQLPTRATPRILIMEDDPDALALYHFMLRQQGYEIFQATTITQARTLLQRYAFDLFLSDILMPDGRGTHLIRDNLPRLRHHGTRIMLATAAAQYRIICDEFDPDIFLMKPFDPFLLVELVERLLRPLPC